MNDNVLTVSGPGDAHVHSEGLRKEAEIQISFACFFFAGIPERLDKQ